MTRESRPPGWASAAPGARPDANREPAPLLRASERDREFEFSTADFDRIRKLIHDHAGIALASAKQDMVYSRLTKRLRACGERRFGDYLARVERDRTEREHFINALTTNLTSFFREAHHFDILAARLKKVPGGRVARIWCCAASTGEEPYSIAITACEAFKTLTPPVGIIASDVNTQVLEEAKAGVYDSDRLAKMSPARLQQFFNRDPKNPRIFRVRPELQRLISFRQVNLLDPRWAVQGPLDAIFCRNVMIYFDKPTQNAILARFAPLLASEGALFAGHSESFLHAADLFRPLGRTVYQRVS